MKAVLISLVLLVGIVAVAPSAEATGKIVCDDRSCLVSIETYVCVTDPCPGWNVCLNRGAVCTDRL